MNNCKFAVSDTFKYIIKAVSNNDKKTKEKFKTK